MKKAHNKKIDGIFVTDEYKGRLIKKIYDLEDRIDKTLEELDKQITFCENDSQGCYEVCNQTITFLKKIKNILRGDTNEK